MKKKVLGMTLLSTAFLMSCATKIEEQKNQQLITQIKQEISVNQQQAKKNLIDINLVEKVPLNAIIKQVCIQQGYTCNTDNVKDKARFDFKGDFSDFLSFLEREYSISFKTYGTTYIFAGKETVIDSEKLNQPISINVSRTPFEYFLSILSDQVGIPIVLEDVVIQTQTGQTGQTATPTATAGQTGQTATPTATAGQTGQLSVKTTNIGYVSYFSTNKPVKQILDEICSQYDLSWREEGEKIVISKYRTAIFKLSLPFLEKQVDLKDDAYKLSYKKQFYNNIEKNMQGILQNNNSKATVTETGYVMAYARPSEIRLIQKFIEKVNEDYSKVIPLKLTIAIVQLSDQYSAGMNLLDLKDLKKTHQTTHIDNKLDMTHKAFTIGITGKPLDMLFNAFGEFGNVRVVENSEYKVLNGQPLVWKPTMKQRILSNIQLSYVPVSAGQGSTATTTQPTITTQTEDIQEGSNLLVVPYMIDNDKIVVDLYRNTSQILTLNQYQINLQGTTNQIILPTIRSDSAVQQTVLHRGERMILLSNVLDKDKITTSGIPFLKDIEGLGLLAGVKGSEKSKYQVLIIVSYGD
jgi:hypothetical protein